MHETVNIKREKVSVGSQSIVSWPIALKSVEKQCNMVGAHGGGSCSLHGNQETEDRRKGPGNNPPQGYSPSDLTSFH